MNEDVKGTDQGGFPFKIIEVLLKRSESVRNDLFLPYAHEKTQMGVHFKYAATEHRVHQIKAQVNNANSELVLVEFIVHAGARFVTIDQKDALEMSVEQEAESVYGKISAEFSAYYHGPVYDEEMLQDFGVNVVPQHVWPFWREHLHSQGQKLRLPMVTLGLYRRGLGADSPLDIRRLFSEFAKPSVSESEAQQ